MPRKIYGNPQLFSRAQIADMERSREAAKKRQADRNARVAVMQQRQKECREKASAMKAAQAQAAAVAAAQAQAQAAAARQAQMQKQLQAAKLEQERLARVAAEQQATLETTKAEIETLNSTLEGMHEETTTLAGRVADHAATDGLAEKVDMLQEQLLQKNAEHRSTLEAQEARHQADMLRMQQLYAEATARIDALTPPSLQRAAEGDAPSTTTDTDTLPSMDLAELGDRLSELAGEEKS